MTESSSQRQIVITGIGLFTPIGIGVDAVRQHLADRISGISHIELLAHTASPDNIAGEVSEFTDSNVRKVYLRKQRKGIKLMCREIQLGVAAALQAVDHSRLNLDSLDSRRLGVEYGAGLMLTPPQVLADAVVRCVEDMSRPLPFQYDAWGNQGMAELEPLWLLCYLPNMPACHIGIAVDAQGPNNSLTMDEASGGVALGEACRIILRDSADVMIAGTTGSRIHPTKAMQAYLWDKLATTPDDPQKRCRPFDADRSGEVIGEGAAALVLEEEAHAKARQATIYGRLLGYGSSCAVDQQRRPSYRTALANAMRSALKTAGLAPEDIGHVNAHGCGSVVIDEQEARAILDVFGEHGRSVPVTSIKSYIGNSSAGCGIQELAASLLSLQRGQVPPTLNHETPDPNCPLNVVHGEPLELDNHVVLSVNVTRMGQASAVVAEAI